MGRYTATVTATSNSTANTEDTFISLTAPSSTAFHLTRVRIFYRGTSTAVGDNNVSARVVSITTAGTGGVSGTAVNKDPEGRSAGSTVTVKTGTTAFTTGTLGNVYSTPSFNERGFYEWIPASQKEWIRSASAGILAVLLQSSVASHVYAVEVEWEE